MFHNWSGFNVNARKENQPNVEYLDKIKSDFPTKEGAIRQIEMVMAQERRVKLAEYRKAWDATPENKKLVLDKINWFYVFGKPHAYTNSITGQGVIATLDGSKMTYESFDPAFRALQHMRWHLLVDDQNLSEVLAVSEDGKERFLLHSKHTIPMGVHSMEAQDHAYLKQIRDYNKDRKEEIIQTYISDGAIVQEVINNTPLALDDFNEAAIKLMFTKNGQQKDPERLHRPCLHPAHQSPDAGYCPYLRPA
ncbi:MAG: hypothetical protein EOP49_52200 [Sphingobacteriales bacterium]|nr:MAG: hypothetical protein EOP49_52200 [Sphingobacteriales bacterium]